MSSATMDNSTQSTGVYGQNRRVLKFTATLLGSLDHCQTQVTIRDATEDGKRVLIALSGRESNSCKLVIMDKDGSTRELDGDWITRHVAQFVNDDTVVATRGVVDADTRTAGYEACIIHKGEVIHRLLPNDHDNSSEVFGTLASGHLLGMSRGPSPQPSLVKWVITHGDREIRNVIPATPHQTTHTLQNLRLLGMSPNGKLLVVEHDVDDAPHGHHPGRYSILDAAGNMVVPEFGKRLDSFKIHSISDGGYVLTHGPNHVLNPDEVLSPNGVLHGLDFYPRAMNSSKDIVGLDHSVGQSFATIGIHQPEATGLSPWRTVHLNECLSRNDRQLKLTSADLIDDKGTIHCTAFYGGKTLIVRLDLAKRF